MVSPRPSSFSSHYQLTNPDLLSNNSAVLDSLSDATNITILAPSNNALNMYLDESDVQDMIMMDSGLVQALLQYHVLNGTYYADNITDTPTFVPTLLDNSTYSNVTGGQVVECMSSGGNVSIYSALKHQSNVTQAVCPRSFSRRRERRLDLQPATRTSPSLAV